MEKELTRSEKIHLGTTEIAKRIRSKLKEEFPHCTFSVTTEHYSGGSSITAALMKSDRKIKLKFNEISERARLTYNNNRYTDDQLKRLQEETYHQLGHFYGDYDLNHWSNGVFLTYQGFNLLKRVYQIADYYNFNESDSQTDYYFVNFSFDLHLGKWNKPFIDGSGFKNDKLLEKNIKNRSDQILKNIEEEKQKKLEEDKNADLAKKWFKNKTDWKNYTLMV